MRYVLALTLFAIAVTGCLQPPPATDPTLAAHIDALAAHIDRIALGLDALNAKVAAPAASASQAPSEHIVCREKKVQKLPLADKKPGDIEMPVKACPPPDDTAACVNGVAISTIASRCEAGKLESK
jgi:hypothetical protein